MKNSKAQLPEMSFKKDGKIVTPLSIFPVNSHFLIGVYQGSFSKYDILIKYRQKNNDKWSRIRTPKHVHWAVDIMIKMHSDPVATKSFLESLLVIWNKTKGIKNESERNKFLSLKNLLELNKQNISLYNKLSDKGEYSINFLILLARLLMVQEKTNLETAYMFKKLLEKLKKNDDIFSIISTAAHNGK
jgi:hypothetical protein